MIEEIMRYGWVTVEWPFQASLRSLAETLGQGTLRQPVNLKTRLEAVRPEDARPGSKSALRGRSGFPLHTDGAHLYVPPRVVLLRITSGKSDCPTVLIDTRALVLPDVLKERLLDGIWVTGNRGFERLVPVFAEWGVRWDEDCMRPVDQVARSAHESLRAILEAARCESHTWGSRDTVLILDNWRMLHGRGRVPDHENRVLERFVMEPFDVGC
jgi:hypothetical protein